MSMKPLVISGGKISELPALELLEIGSHKGKTLVYTAGVLTSLLLYKDAAKTLLDRTISLIYTSGILTSLEYRDSENVLILTKTLSYDAGKLVGIEEI